MLSDPEARDGAEVQGDARRTWRVDPLSAMRGWQVIGPVVGVLLLAGVAAWGIESKVQADRHMALDAYRGRNMQLMHEATDRIGEKLNQIHQNLRTISLLPGVRELTRHGENLTEHSLITIQQVYNNLASNVEVSEVYVVPASFNPDRLDPITGEFEEPTLMFDELIVDAGKKTEAHGDHEAELEEEEVEALEYAVLRRQIDWLRQHHPDTSTVNGLDRPMVSSEEVIICDNTVYVRTGKDSDRSGIVLSVPYYGVDGQLAGVISAIIRTTALAGYLPVANGALVNTAHGYVVTTQDDTLPMQSRAHVLAGRPNPALLFSGVAVVGEADPQGKWLFWAGLPDKEFWESADVRAIEAFKTTAYAILALVVAGLLVAIMAVNARARDQRARQMQLKREVEARLAQIEVLERAKTETLAAREAAERARIAAEAANEAKSQFLANMSHEIRTPLNGVLGIAQALRTDVPAAQQEKVDLILESGRSLTHLLGDILDLSKIEAGKLEIAPAPGDFIESMRRVWELFRSHAQSKGLDYQLHVPTDFPRYLAYDDHRVRQCVGNFLSNAVKFTATGRVTLTLSAKPEKAGRHILAIQVSDSGIGMSKEAMSRLFQPFVQADNSTTRQFGGTGLGLSIARKLARLMGGDVRMQSEIGRGSSFTLLLRVAEAEAPVAAQGHATAFTRPSSLQGARVLLTDDNALNRRVIRLMLAGSACEITEAANGREALEALSRQAFDILLLDAHMPVMDGPETIKAIRTSDATWKDMPVIALTADAMAGDRDKYLAMGMNDYLSKPVDKNELLARMSALLGGASQMVEERRAAG